MEEGGLCDDVRSADPVIVFRQAALPRSPCCCTLTGDPAKFHFTDVLWKVRLSLRFAPRKLYIGASAMLSLSRFIKNFTVARGNAVASRPVGGNKVSAVRV